jgi:hypothetical protein
MPNKEQRKFKQVIKKRRSAEYRKLHPKPIYKFVEVMKPNEKETNTTSN